VAPALTTLLQAQVRALRDPAYVLDEGWNALAWNAAAGRLFADWLGPPRVRADESEPRNLLRHVFLEPAARRFIDDWPERAQRLVAEYRADSVARRDEPLHRDLVRELRSASPHFDAAWRSQRVLAREGGRRVFHHPEQGRLCFEQLTWRLAQQQELKLIVLLPQGPDS
jgi:hypothetical protein